MTDQLAEAPPAPAPTSAASAPASAPASVPASAPAALGTVASDADLAAVTTKEIGRAARGSAINLVGAFVTAVTTFGLTILVTRNLDQTTAGVFFSTTSLFLLATAVGQLGTDSGLVYFMSRARTTGRRDLIPVYFRAAMRPVLCCAFAMMVLLLVLAHPVARLIAPGHAGYAADCLIALAFFIPLAGIEQVCLSATRGLGTMRANAMVEQLWRPVLQIALVAVALALPLTGNLSWWWSVPYAFAAIAAWLWWRRLAARATSATADDSTGAHGAEAADPGDHAGRAREFWRFSAPRSLASVVQQAMQRLDIVLVGAMAGAPAAAIYTATTRFVVAGQMARNSVSLAVQPQLAAALSREHRAGVNELYHVSTAWLMGVTWPIYLILLFDGGPLLRVFGHGYNTGTTVLVLLALSMLVATFCGDVDVMLIMAGKTTWSLSNVAVAFGLNLALDIWLIPIHGLVGAAIGWSVAIAAKNLLALSQVGISLRLHPFGLATTAVAVSTVVCYGVALLGARWLLGSGAVGFLAGVLVASVAYAGCIWMFRHSLRLYALMPRRLQPAAGRHRA